MCAALLGCASPVLAQGLESVLAPGKLIKAHAKTEDDCKACHVKFERNGQDRLCAECHKEVGQDMRAKTGFHGRQKPQACRSCHTDHKGREARIVDFDEKSFDHNNQSDYVLRGKHIDTKCVGCHKAGKKWSEAPQDCNSCHKKDDKHKGGLGPKCADCHGEADWKKVVFDHDKTRFVLRDKHIDAKCDACHKDNKFKDTPRTCLGCHKKDDDGQKGHKGLYGEKCDSCHNAKAWKPSTFNHDRDTKYALKGKHGETECKSCHTGNLYKVKLSADCYSCHKKDDKHKDTLGHDCAACHTERTWKDSGTPGSAGKFDHNKSSFPLLGKHAKVECKDCHKSPLFKEAPKDCYSCHKKDDKHDGTLGKDCAACHVERDWKTTAGRFDHDKTRFALRNGHASPPVKCGACHVDLKTYRKAPLDCYSCHKKDDKHEGQLNLRCESCHNDKSWKTTNFDHASSRFALTGGHIKTACKDCHKSLRYKDAPRDCYSCHKKDDKHKLKFGVKCESCHNARSWRIWDFNHDKRTDYKLDGAHRKVACESCHKSPAPSGKLSATLGSSCVACHRSEDVHDGNFGLRCEQCHSTENWKKISNRSMGASGESEQPVAVGNAAPRFAGVPLFNYLLGWSSHVARRHDIESAGSRPS
ncbi:MAG: cytochrome c3 family protein [Leptothrix sp. (in: b-proteobacteria)]